jgi:glycine/serine hydroxymethyltransferase
MSGRQHTQSPYRHALELQSDALKAAVTRSPVPPESSVTIGTTAKRIHTWEITVRGDDVEECGRIAQRIDDALAAKFAHELDTDTLAADLARSVVK